VPKDLRRISFSAVLILFSAIFVSVFNEKSQSYSITEKSANLIKKKSHLDASIIKLKQEIKSETKILLKEFSTLNTHRRMAIYFSNLVTQNNAKGMNFNPEEVGSLYYNPLNIHILRTLQKKARKNQKLIKNIEQRLRGKLNTKVPLYIKLRTNLKTIYFNFLNFLKKLNLYIYFPKSPEHLNDRSIGFDFDLVSKEPHFIRKALSDHFESAKLTPAKKPWEGTLVEMNFSPMVRAIHKGKVVFAEYFKTLGLLVIIDHGERYHSLYGNLNKVFVEKDQLIEQGTVVGTIRSTNFKKNLSIYFEIRKNGQTINISQ